MMRILIVDDEAPARLRLRKLLEEIPDAAVVDEAANGEEALNKVAQHDPDVVLLDIRMPGMDGLECAAHLTKLDTPPAVIFTTAYDQFAVQAFEARALAYLLKPIRRDKLADALDHARRLNAAQKSAIENQRREMQGARQHICARVRDSLKLVPVDSIHYFHADQKYVTVRHRDGEVLIEESLKSLEDEFGAEFTRIHRNALVATKDIEALEKDPGGHFHVRVRGCGDLLEVSRRLVPEVRRLIRNG